MNCRRVRDLMGPYLYGDLAAEEMRKMRLHAQECDSCRRDLRSRGAVVTVLDNTPPALTDEEKLKIAWSVKGAVKAGEPVREAWRLSPAAAFALAAMLLLGLAMGKIITLRIPSFAPASKQARRSPESDTPRAVVKITEEQETPTANSNTKTAAGKPTPEESAAMKMADRIVTLVRGSGLAARSNHQDRRGTTIVPEPPATVVAGEDQDAKPEGGEVKLPKPTDLNDAQTAPGPGE